MTVREIAKGQPRAFSLNYNCWHRGGAAVLVKEWASHNVNEFPKEIVTLDAAWANRELRICVRSLDGLLVQTQQLPSYLGRDVQP